MTDPRLGDVREAEQMLAAVERDGAVKLPELIAVDLCVLRAAMQSVFDEPVWRAWMNLPDAYRDELTADVLNGLVRRRLMERPTSNQDEDTPPMSRVAPPLAMIMAARSQPAFIAVCSVDGEQRGGPRLYGVAEVERGLRAVLVEQQTLERIGFGTSGRVKLSAEEDRRRVDDLHQLYRYILVSAEQAVKLLVSWLTESQAGIHDDLGAEQAVDIYRHREGEPFTGERLAARPGMVRCASTSSRVFGWHVERGGRS